MSQVIHDGLQEMTPRKRLHDDDTTNACKRLRVDDYGRSVPIQTNHSNSFTALAGHSVCGWSSQKTKSILTYIDPTPGAAAIYSMSIWTPKQSMDEFEQWNPFFFDDEG